MGFYTYTRVGLAPPGIQKIEDKSKNNVYNN